MRSTLAVITWCFVLSCTSKQETNEWQGMDDFHFVLAACYHPYADSGYMEPAFSQRGDLAEAASEWAGAAIPEAVNTPAIRDLLNELEQATRSFASLDAGDSTAAEKLTHIHDLFHQLERSWYESSK